MPEGLEPIRAHNFREELPLDVSKLQVGRELRMLGELTLHGQWRIDVWRSADVQHIRIQDRKNHPLPLGSILTAAGKVSHRKPLDPRDGADIAVAWLTARGVRGDLQDGRYADAYPDISTKNPKLLHGLFTVRRIVK